MRSGCVRAVHPGRARRPARGRPAYTQPVRSALVAVVTLASGCNLLFGLDPVTHDDGAVTDAATDDGRPPLDDADPGDATPTRDTSNAPDARSLDAGLCPVAPTGCTAFTCAGITSCYYVCEATTYENAKVQCGQRNIGCLATIDTLAENVCINSNAVPMLGMPVWFGWFQSDTNNEPLGGWQWVCGDSAYRGPGWGSVQPDNGSGPEDCGAMGTASAWTDDDCVKAYRFVCEL